jgi:translocation and assembly module TamB
MKRRRLIALIALCTLAAIGIVVVVAGAIVMRTDIPRNFVQGLLASRINGRVYVGRISGNPLGGLTVDTFAIRDRAGELVVSTGRLSFDYDIRDLADQRLYLRHVVAEHPHVHLRDFGNGKWNYKLLAKPSTGPKVNTPGRGWGDFIVLDSVAVSDASFFLSLPWSPDASLTQRQRDSVVRHELGRTDRRVQKTAEGYARTYMWTKATGLISRARLADPDSNRFGQEIHIASLDANEFDPPFVFRNLRGRVRRLGDSAWLNVSHWDLPGSTGSASGKLVWGSERPIRYDLVVRGDSMSLSDVNWVYATLPKTGGGRMVLRISNKRNDRIMDYHLDSMDVRSTGSRLVGEMTWGVGGPVLQLRNVNMRMDPVDFALIKALNGKPFPIDWRGQIYGDIRAPGGPLDEFAVASARGEWRDTHVPGAVSRLSGSGNLDIFAPAFTAFHDFDVNVHSLDLRSIEFLFPAFPKLRGTIAGTATLDSVWTDVRFSNASITHRDGPGTPSHFTGSGRITDGSPYITYDVDLNADPLSFDMLARSFPGLTLRGLAYGPVKIKGQSPDLEVVTNLVSAAGALRFAGNIDIDSLGGYGARGVGEITNVNLATLGIKANAPKTALTGAYTIDVRGSSASSLTGTADVRLGRSTYDRITLDSLSRASVRFENGRVITNDSLIISSPMGRIAALGALGLPRGGADSIALTLVVDSVGGLRPYFNGDGTAAAADTLLGRVTLNGYALGRLDSLFLRGGIAGENLNIRGVRARRLDGTFAIADALRSPSGQINADLIDSVRVGGLVFDTLRTAITLVDTTEARFAVNGRALAGDSLTMSALGTWRLLAGATAVRMDSFALAFADSRWTLERPATLFTDSTTLRIDSLGLRNARGGSIGLAGAVPVNGAIDLRLSATRLPLSDLDRVVGQVQAPVRGFADFSGQITGTRASPVIDARTSLDSIAISDVRIGKLFGTARYSDNRGFVSADILQGDKRVLRAVADSLPLAIRWFSWDTLPGRVRASAVADSADFTLVQAWVDMISNVTGKVSGSLSLDGTWRNPNLVAGARLTDGAMRIDTLGIALSRMFGRVSYRNDTLRIDSVRVQSGGEANVAALDGKVAFRDWSPSWFDLSMRMNDFLAYDRPELATIYARTSPANPIHLRGTFLDDTLSGEVFVDQGAIYLPDPKLVGKRFSALDSAGFVLATRKKTLYELATDSLKTELTAHIGGAFKLSADYADIPLSGDLSIVPVTVTDAARRSGDYISRLAPLGTINADRGTYTLLFPPIFSKTFDVQRGGTITFDRDARWNGILNVSARYVVRKPGRPEVPIVIDVTDRLLTPRVKPRSEASFPISESDLISYIVFDEPGFFDVLGQTSATAGSQTLLSSLFTPIATSATAEFFRQRIFGRWVDQLRVESVAVDQGAQSTFTNRSLRLTGGKELVEGRVYLSLSTGLCTLNQNSAQANANFGTSLAQQLGASIEYRLRTSLTTGATWQFATEPSTQSLLCSPGYSGSLGIAPTPRQLSLSFLRFWRW